MAKTKSGAFWVAWANQNAPNSNHTADLTEPFRSHAKAFIAALEAAGATVHVKSTLRHPKRAFLFHWCWLVALDKKTAADADAHPMAGVDIEWDHGNTATSRAGAQEMVDGFGLAVPPKSKNAPALTSNHITGNAIDMDIHWTGTLHVQKQDGSTVSVHFDSDPNRNTALHDVGASYGVKKLTTDAPHWSSDGR